MPGNISAALFLSCKVRRVDDQGVLHGEVEAEVASDIPEPARIGLSMHLAASRSLAGAGGRMKNYLTGASSTAGRADVAAAGNAYAVHLPDGKRLAVRYP